MPAYVMISSNYAGQRQLFSLLLSLLSALDPSCGPFFFSVDSLHVTVEPQSLRYCFLRDGNSTLQSIFNDE